MNFIQAIADYFSCRTDTIVTIIISLTIFISGILINLIITRIKNAIYRSNYRKFIKEIIENISIYSKKQSKELNKLHNQLKSDYFEEFHVIKRYVESSLNIFDKVPLEKIYDSYFRGFVFNNRKRRNALRFILNNTQLINKIHSDLDSNIGEFMNKYSKLYDDWKNSNKEMKIKYDKLRKEYLSGTINPKYIPLIEDIADLLAEWKKVKNKDSKVEVKKNIIDKFPQIINKNKSLDIIIDFENLIADAKMAYKNMEDLLNSYAKFFLDQEITLRNYSRKMKIAQKIISVKIFCR